MARSVEGRGRKGVTVIATGVGVAKGWEGTDVKCSTSVKCCEYSFDPRRA